MRHSFTSHYTADDKTQRTRCARCGVGSHWPAAGDSCSGPVSDLERLVGKPRSARSRSRGKATRGPDGRVYPSLAAMCEAHGQCPDIVRGVLRRIPTLTPAGAVLHCEREAAE